MDPVADKRAFFESGAVRMMERIYATALRFTRNPADAEDLMAETLSKAWQSFDALSDRACFDGWMMRILSNTYISQWRRSKVRAEIFDDDLCTDDLDDSGSLYARLHQPFLLWFGSPEKTFVNDLLKRDIERALDELPEAYRRVVVMVEILGFTYGEVAKSLAVPVGTVRSRLNRGRRRLQLSLWQNARDAGLVGEQISEGSV